VLLLRHGHVRSDELIGQSISCPHCKGVSVASPPTSMQIPPTVLPAVQPYSTSLTTTTPQPKPKPVVTKQLVTKPNGYKDSCRCPQCRAWRAQEYRSSCTCEQCKWAKQENGW
jgi:hypothetical protein